MSIASAAFGISWIEFDYSSNSGGTGEVQGFAIANIGDLAVARSQVRSLPGWGTQIDGNGRPVQFGGLIGDMHVRVRAADIVAAGSLSAAEFINDHVAPIGIAVNLSNRMSSDLKIYDT